jgi:hypothetical protein
MFKVLNQKNLEVHEHYNCGVVDTRDHKISCDPQLKLKLIEMVFEGLHDQSHKISKYLQAINLSIDNLDSFEFFQ